MNSAVQARPADFQMLPQTELYISCPKVKTHESRLTPHSGTLITNYETRFFKGGRDVIDMLG